MEGNTSNQEVLRVTVNGNCSIFVKDTFKDYLSLIEDSLRTAKGPDSIFNLCGFSDSHTTRKAAIFLRASDCIKVSQFS